ncbi:MAG: transcriptional regulator GlxA family with amidase domain [Paraglaciecola sp.]|jgi:transcriptional regulator GlxA family with amidase domain
MNIGIYIYDNAEVLDFSGPFEVFSTAKRLAQNNWHIFFVAQADTMVKARGDFDIKPHYNIENHPPIDVLMIVGGVHSEEVKKTSVIQWIAKVAQRSQQTVSVCTGAFLLAEAGLLTGLSVTTHWQDITDLQSTYPQLTVLPNRRWVRAGKFITSGGISAGIDMSLYLVSQLSSPALAEKTARQMEYHWQQ